MEEFRADNDAIEPLVREDISEIMNYFKDSTIFITGATGFLGKLLLEKLLRTCQDLRKIYVLIRPKTGCSVSGRLNEIFQNQLFERMKIEHPDYMEKVSIIRGECTRLDLGLSKKDRELLTAEVNCIFHCAAVVSFDEQLRTASYVNVRATREVLRMAKEMKCLKSMVHVSSAFSHCHRQDIDEEFHRSFLTCKELLTFVDALTDADLGKIKSTIIGDCPNTYTFTKAVAEDVIKTYGLGLPIAIVRPTMVVATAKEPIAGWIDNLYGPTGLLVASNLGITRSTLANPKFVADVVPADYVVNLLLAASWHVANLQTFNENKESVGCGKRVEDDIPIYNVATSSERPLTWDKYMCLSTEHSSKIPSTLSVSHNWNKVNSNESVHRLYVFFLHYLPAIFLDVFAFTTGTPPLLMLTYKKIDEFTNAFKYFTLNQWYVRNKNTQQLWKKLSAVDKQLFEFDVSILNWDQFYESYMRGIRVYVLKDPLDTVLKGSSKYTKMKILHYLAISVVMLGIYWALKTITCEVFDRLI